MYVAATMDVAVNWLVGMKVCYLTNSETWKRFLPPPTSPLLGVLLQGYSTAILTTWHGHNEFVECILGDLGM